MNEPERGTALATRDEAPLPAVGPPSPAEWASLKEQASTLARSGLVPGSLRNRPDDVLVIALAGRELGLPPMSALNKVHVVDGRPVLSAEVMCALVQRAGHEIWIEETSLDRAIAAGSRRGSERVQRVEFSMADAERAGVSKKSNWKNYPAAMLRARAISGLCRFAFADVLMGHTYTPEELGAEVDETGNVVEAVVVQPPDWIAEQRALGHRPAAILEAAKAVAAEAGAKREIRTLGDLEDMPQPLREAVADRLVGAPEPVPAAASAENGAEPEQSPPAEPEQTESATAAEPEPEPTTNLCPACGSPCAPVGMSSKRAPKWRCSNNGCTGGPDDGPWLSWHNDPWKPGGEIETEYGGDDSAEPEGAGSNETPDGAPEGPTGGEATAEDPPAPQPSEDEAKE